MTNYNERLDEVLGIFSGGITGKGSDRGGYPTYFTEPYPIWCEARKNEAKQALIDWHNKQTEALLNELLVDVSSPSARIDQAEMIELINLYINKLKESK